MADILDRASQLGEQRARPRPAAQPRGRAGHSRRDVPVGRGGRGRARDAAAGGLLSPGARAHLLGDERPVRALGAGRPPLGRRPAGVHRRTRGGGRQAVPARRHRRRRPPPRTGRATPRSSSALSTLRQLIGAGTEIVALGYDAPDDLDEVVGDAEKIIFDVTNKRVQSNFKYINELLKVSFKELEELAERKQHITGVPTGFKELDKLLAGLHQGDLVHPRRASVGRQDGARAQHRRQRRQGRDVRRGLLA